MNRQSSNAHGLPIPRVVVLASIDSLRYDCINAQPCKPFLEKLGSATSFDTPTTDALVEESVYCSKAIAHAGYTPLSHATLFTGTYARTHGVVDFATTWRHKSVRTLTDILSAYGYRTIVTGLAAKLFVKDSCSLAKVDHVFEHETDALDLIQSQRDEAFVLVSHFNDVHYPQVLSEFPSDDPSNGHDYDLYLRQLWGGKVVHPDKPRDATQDIRLRNGQTVSFMDLVASKPSESGEVLARHLWQLVEAYLFGWEKFDRNRWSRFIGRLRHDDRWAETCVCMVADHGEQQRPHYPWSIQHGSYCNEQLVRVPLVIRSPGLNPRRMDELVGLVDVLPTLLDLCGIDVEELDLPYQLDGSSLLGGAHQSTNRHYYIENYEAHLPASSKQIPVIANRAIRYADGRKYLFSGESIDESRLETMDDKEAIIYLGQQVMGHTPTPFFQAKINAALQNSPRSAVVQWLMTLVPRQTIYNVDQDPLEQNGVAVQPGHPRWHEYATVLETMRELTGEPNSRHTRTVQDEHLVTERLRALGYVEQ